MAARDIMPFNSPHGGHVKIIPLPIDTASAFLQGEPVLVNADGELSEAADDPDVTAAAGGATNVIGIAASSAQGVADINTADGLIATASTDGFLCPVYMFESDTEFICTNFATDGAGTLVAPTNANAGGELAGLTLNGGVWSVDVGTARKQFRIIRILDADKKDISQSGQAGDFVVFKLAHF